MTASVSSTGTETMVERCGCGRAGTRSLRRQRVMQAPGELGVAIEQGLDPETAKDAERRLLGQGGEPDQRGVELRRRRREVHGRSVEALERVTGGLPAGTTGWMRSSSARRTKR